MRPIFTAAAAALLSLALAGCETTGTSSETTGSISSGEIKGSELKFGYATRPHAKLISSHAKTNGIDESLAHAVISIESNYRANARGAAGEVGLMQIKPSTARMMGYRGSTKALYNPETNIKYGMKYLAMAQKLGDGSTCGTILKYNAGHGAKRMNPISKRYCGKVMSLMK